MLRLSHVSISVDETPIISSLSLHAHPGTIHALMGPNGSGKSTLAYALAGHPHYTITGGTVQLHNQDITDWSPDKRARAGLFLAFQQPPAIPGVRVMTFLKEAHHAVTGKPLGNTEFQELLRSSMEMLSIDPLFAHRYLNDGFSGGERKKFELLQLLLLQPKVAILDEIDSGLDIDALKTVAHGIACARKNNPDMVVVMITHYQRLLDYISPDHIHVLCDGRVVESGDAGLALELEKRGYDEYKQPGR